MGVGGFGRVYRVKLIKEKLKQEEEFSSSHSDCQYKRDNHNDFALKILYDNAHMSADTLIDAKREIKALCKITGRASSSTSTVSTSKDKKSEEEEEDRDNFDFKTSNTADSLVSVYDALQNQKSVSETTSKAKQKEYLSSPPNSKSSKNVVSLFDYFTVLGGEPVNVDCPFSSLSSPQHKNPNLNIACLLLELADGGDLYRWVKKKEKDYKEIHASNSLSSSSSMLLENNYGGKNINSISIGEASCSTSRDSMINFSSLVSIFKQMSAGVRQVHSKRILHLDVKLENFVICLNHDHPNPFTVKLTDFGACRSLVEDRDNDCKTDDESEHQRRDRRRKELISKISSFNNDSNSSSSAVNQNQEAYVACRLGTVRYMAPEMVWQLPSSSSKSTTSSANNNQQTVKVGKSADLWSLGICFYRLLFGIFPSKHDGVSETEILLAIRDRCHEIEYYEIEFPELSRVSDIIEEEGGEEDEDESESDDENGKQTAEPNGCEKEEDGNDLYNKLAEVEGEQQTLTNPVTNVIEHIDIHQQQPIVVKTLGFTHLPSHILQRGTTSTARSRTATTNSTDRTTITAGATGSGSGPEGMIGNMDVIKTSSSSSSGPGVTVEDVHNDIDTKEERKNKSRKKKSKRHDKEKPTNNIREPSNKLSGNDSSSKVSCMGYYNNNRSNSSIHTAGTAATSSHCPGWTPWWAYNVTLPNVNDYRATIDVIRSCLMFDEKDRWTAEMVQKVLEKIENGRLELDNSSNSGSSSSSLGCSTSGSSLISSSCGASTSSSSVTAFSADGTVGKSKNNDDKNMLKEEDDNDIVIVDVENKDINLSLTVDTIATVTTVDAKKKVSKSKTTNPPANTIFGYPLSYNNRLILFIIMIIVLVVSVALIVLLVFVLTNSGIFDDNGSCGENEGTKIEPGSRTGSTTTIISNKKNSGLDLDSNQYQESSVPRCDTRESFIASLIPATLIEDAQFIHDCMKLCIQKKNDIFRVPSKIEKMLDNFVTAIEKKSIQKNINGDHEDFFLILERIFSQHRPLFRLVGNSIQDRALLIRCLPRKALFQDQKMCERMMREKNDISTHSLLEDALFRWGKELEIDNSNVSRATGRDYVLDRLVWGHHWNPTRTPRIGNTNTSSTHTDYKDDDFVHESCRYLLKENFNLIPNSEHYFIDTRPIGTPIPYTPRRRGEKFKVLLNDKKIMPRTSEPGSYLARIEEQNKDTFIAIRIRQEELRQHLIITNRVKK